MSAREDLPHQLPDELRLVDLWRILVRRKAYAAAGFLVCLTVGVAYAFLATPKYEVDVYLDKSYPNELAAINLGRTPATGLAPFDGEFVFGYFSSSLVSEDLRQRFFNEIYLPSLDESERDEPKHLLYEKMIRSIKVSKPDAKGRGLFNLKVEADSGEKTVERATAFLSLAASHAAEKFVEDARNEIELTVRNTERDLAELRLTMSQKREDRLVQLGEALQVAQAVGLTSPEITNGRLPEQEALRPWMDGSQLYARGTKSLRAELEVLKARETDDPFIANLRDTQARLRQLKAIQLDPKLVRVFNADGQILVPQNPIAPNRTLIVAFACVLSVPAGVALAFARKSLLKRVAGRKRGCARAGLH